MVFDGRVEPLDPTSSHLRAHTSVGKKPCQAKKLLFLKGIQRRAGFDDPWGSLPGCPTPGWGPRTPREPQRGREYSRASGIQASIWVTRVAAERWVDRKAGGVEPPREASPIRIHR